MYIMIKGSIVVIVIFMYLDGSFDYDGLCKLIDWYIVEGIDSIVIVGIIGELFIVLMEEYCELIKVVVEYMVKCIFIIVGIGGNFIFEVIELIVFVKKVGVDVLLQVVLYYNCLIQEGMYLYFKIIVEVVDLLVILYNVFGCMVVDMSNEIILCLVQVKGIVGVKDVIGNIGCGIDLICLVFKDFVVYLGDDVIVIVLMLYGGVGNILVMVNVVLCDMYELCVVVMSGNIVCVVELNNKLLLLYNKFFVEFNLVLVKWVMQEMGLILLGMCLLLVLLGVFFYDIVCVVLCEFGVLN